VGDSTELAEVVIFSIFGQEVTMRCQQIEKDGNKLILDLSRLDPGIYYIKTQNSVKKVYKQ
jgi:hypothetical protein